MYEGYGRGCHFFFSFPLVSLLKLILFFEFYLFYVTSNVIFLYLLKSI